jgi:hypothetical protein
MRWRISGASRTSPASFTRFSRCVTPRENRGAAHSTLAFHARS